jgi:hypothetical protein
MENTSVLELVPVSKLLLLLLLGQSGFMIFYNWILKSIHLLKNNPLKFFGILMFSCVKYTYYSYYISNLNTEEIIQNSIIWIPVITFIFINFCVHYD